MKRIVLHPLAIRLSAPCKQHRCICTHPRAQQHIAGTPCTDFSSMGTMQREEGATAMAFLTWCAMRLRLQENFIFHENVSSFPIALLLAIFGSCYYVYTAILSPTMIGLPFERMRRLTMLVHRRVGELSHAWGTEAVKVIFGREKRTNK